MSFLNLKFYLCFFVIYIICLLLQIVLKKKKRVSNEAKKTLLLFFSIYVIYCYDVRFCFCIVATTVVAYVCGFLIERNRDRGTKWITTFGVTILVFSLAYFKYYNFFVGSIVELAGGGWHSLDIILPIGISFYTFSAISYVLDVYWNVIPCEKSFLDLFLFISFFPKIVCGPVVRARDFLPQLKDLKELIKYVFRTAYKFLSLGYLRK